MKNGIKEQSVSVRLMFDEYLPPYLKLGYIRYNARSVKRLAMCQVFADGRNILLNVATVVGIIFASMRHRA